MNIIFWLGKIKRFLTSLNGQFHSSDRAGDVPFIGSDQNSCWGLFMVMVVLIGPCKRHLPGSIEDWPFSEGSWWWDRYDAASVHSLCVMVRMSSIDH